MVLFFSRLWTCLLQNESVLHIYHRLCFSVIMFYCNLFYFVFNIIIAIAQFSKFYVYLCFNLAFVLQDFHN